MKSIIEENLLRIQVIFIFSLNGPVTREIKFHSAEIAIMGNTVVWLSLSYWKNLCISLWLFFFLFQSIAKNKLGTCGYRVVVCCRHRRGSIRHRHWSNCLVRVKLYLWSSSISRQFFVRMDCRARGMGKSFIFMFMLPKWSKKNWKVWVL